MLTSEEKLARFEKSLEYGGNTHSVADVVQLVKDGRAQFWTNGDGNIVSEVLEFPQFRAINFWLLSGRLRDILALEDDVLSFARERGCTRAIAMGRLGWGRVSAATGWRHVGHHFAKSLTGSP